MTADVARSLQVIRRLLTEQLAELRGMRADVQQLRREAQEREKAREAAEDPPGAGQRKPGP